MGTQTSALGKGAGELRVGEVDLVACAVGEGDGRAEGGVEGAVGGEDVEFGGGVGFVLGGVSWHSNHGYLGNCLSLFVYERGEESGILTSPPYGHALVCFTVYLLAKSKAPSAIPR